MLSIEITKECPLNCPGCYAYHPDHLAGAPLTSLADYRGDELIGGALDLIQAYRPLTVYLVGGEPLVRFRELNELIPEICRRGIHVEMVTSAVRPIPESWAEWSRLAINVSIDGLQPEHDERRKPATYERILKHIQGHRIFVHCTVTSRMMGRPGYLEEFVRFWSARPEVIKIRVSLFTPQVGETSEEILTKEMRRRAVAELDRLRGGRFPKLQVGWRFTEALLDPPRYPGECLFAQITECFSADLKTRVQPCQLGGHPNCRECGCAASAGLHAVGRYRLPGGVKVATVFEISRRIGSGARRLRRFWGMLAHHQGGLPAHRSL